MTAAFENDDGFGAVNALLAAISTLRPAEKEALFRRFVDSLHVERQQDLTLLSPAVQRDMRLIGALRSVTDVLGHTPATTEYIAAYKRARAAGDTTLPSVSTFLKRYRTWRSALFAAGLMGPPSNLITQRRLLRTRPPRYPRARIIACLQACANDVGRVPGVRDYDAWREQKRRESVASGRISPDFPHRNTIVKHFRLWTNALTAAGFDYRLDRRHPPEWWTPTDPDHPDE